MGLALMEVENYDREMEELIVIYFKDRCILIIIYGILNKILYNILSTC